MAKLTLPLDAPPVNEMGVVCLFAMNYAKSHGLKIIEIGTKCPDAIVVRHKGGTEKRIRIEFEFRASNFKAHKHNICDVDCIVCWINDWPDKPKSLNIIELRDEYGMGWGFWHHGLPNSGERADGDVFSYDGFHPQFFKSQSVFEKVIMPAHAKLGDLVLCSFHASKAACKRAGVDKSLAGVFHGGMPEFPQWLLGIGRINKIDNEVTRRASGNSVFATLRRVIAFDPIIKGGDIFNHPSVNICRDNTNLTPRWPEIRRRLIQLRPETESKLSRYA